MTDQELEKIYSEAYRAVYWTAFSLLKEDQRLFVCDAGGWRALR